MFCIFVLIIFFEFLVALVDSSCSSGNGCPTSCKCEFLQRGGLRIDCFSRHLIQLPAQLPSETVELFLNNNAITIISNDSFYNCQQLRLLDLSNNQISQLDANSFSSATHLEILYLNDNKLNYSHLPTNIFKPVSGLLECRLHNNQWNDLTDYPQGLFRYFEVLKVLTLDGFPNVEFGCDFAMMAKLKTLKIYGGIDIVRNRTLAAFANTSVTELVFRSVQTLYDFEAGCFSHFRHLETLDLSYNRQIGLTNVSNAWWGLQFTSIRNLLLSQIMPDQFREPYLEKTFFKYLNLTKIDYFSLSKNSIVKILQPISLALPNLIHLDLSYNRIASTEDIAYDLAYLRQLKFFDFSYQTKQFYDSNDDQNRLLTKSQAEPTLYNVHDSVESQSSDDWFSECRTSPIVPCSFKLSDFLHNAGPNVSLISPSALKLNVLVRCFITSSHLEVINMTQSLMLNRDWAASIIYLGNSKLKLLKLGKTDIRKLIKPILFSEPLTLSFDLSDNDLSCVASDILKYPIKLGSVIQEIGLSGNNLAQQLRLDQQGLTFYHYSKTKVLDLSRNAIKFLPPNVFNYTVGLQKLNLSQNSLQLIEFRFSHMLELTELDLSYNLLTTLDDSVAETFKVMFQSNSRNSNLSIDLTGNPLQCSCDTLPFLAWASNHREHLKNFEKYTCYFNKTFVPLERLRNFILVELQDICSRKVAVVVSASVVVFVLMLTAISIFCYRYRWEIRFYCLWLTQRSQVYRNEVDDTDYEYDAFVVYACGDGDWVREKLVTQLESFYWLDDGNNQRRLKICIHERDFLPGSNILDNIWTTIEKSRRVILVMSPHFARSHYCEYELNLARMESIQKNRNLFLPILLEPVKLRTIPDGLRWVLRKMTYIEWPREEHQIEDRAEFWEKLKDAVTDSTPLLSFQRR